MSVIGVEVKEEHEVIIREVKGAYLKHLEIVDFEMSPSFDVMNNIYTLSVPSDIDYVEVYYEAKNIESRTQIIGNNDLGYGENIIIITVSYENDTQEYRIIVTREEEQTTLVNAIIEDDESITDVPKDKYLITMIASASGISILFLGLIIFTRKRKD